MAKKRKQPETVVEEKKPVNVVEPVQKTGSVAILAQNIRHNETFYAKGSKLSQDEVKLIKSIGLGSYIQQ